jgi:hypothetical protein
VRVNLTSRRSSVCSPGDIGAHSYRLSLESRHLRQEARCFNIEHAELVPYTALFMTQLRDAAISHAREASENKKEGRKTTNA